MAFMTELEPEGGLGGLALRAAPSDATTATPVYPSSGTIDAGLLGANVYWAAGQFTYSIPIAGSAWSGYAAGTEPGDPGYSVLNATQATAFRAAIAAWDRLIAPNFTETNDLTATGNIRVAFSGYNQAGGWGYAYFPNFNGSAASPPQSGDIWISSANTATTFGVGGGDLEALLHEIGHALGLKHPFEDPQLPAALDNTRYTVMAYALPADGYVVSFSGTSNSIQSSVTPLAAATPMVLDIAAVQDRYGADLTTATGDNVYVFSDSTSYLQTIYDAGGVDTFDLSAVTRNSTVDLHPGAYSSVAAYSVAAQIAHWTAIYPDFAPFISSTLNASTTFTWTDNVGIALTTLIENAIGGSGADSLTGNSAANILTGGAGADTLNGDTGRDVARYSVASTAATWTHNGDGSWTVTAGADGTDTLTAMEVLRFTDHDVLLTQPARSDFNLDGKSDVLWRNDSGEIYVWNSQSGQGAFQGQTLGNPGLGWHVQDVADYSGDGKADILWRNNAGDLYVYKSDAGANVSFTGQSISYVDPVWAVVPQTGDFNGDGRADILFRNSGTGEVYVWNSQTGSAAVNFLGQSLGTVGTNWSIKGVGDFNADGRADVLWRSDAGDVYVWLDSPTGAPAMSGQTISSVGNDWSILGLGDFNGDGRDDILWRHAGDGELYVWNSQLGSPAVNFLGQSLGVVGLDWSVAAIGDYDGDGRADVLFRNADGRVYLWNSNDTGAVGFVGQGLGQTPVDWHILSDFHGM